MMQRIIDSIIYTTRPRRKPYFIACFLMYAAANPQDEYQVTQIGCGFAGWTKEEIAPLFVRAPEVCLFDTDWEPFLDLAANGKPVRYWGHV